ncbi:MAG: small multi-drug export protein, partial [Candidatus Buchananbacteria bacterium]|nr:small multi-drug export protein [Candidatus Buchananbacteria bacterium]
MGLSAFFLVFPPELATFLLALLPLTELRASIPIGIFVYHLPAFSAFFYSVLGNLVAGYLVLVLINPIANYFKNKFKVVKLVLDWWFNRVYNRFLTKYQKYGPVALVIFV